jgi:nucleoside phosphorylase
MSSKPRVDILILVAVPDELRVIREVEDDWVENTDSSGYPYYIRDDIGLAGNSLSIAIARPINMGGDFAANLATRLIIELRPRCLAMVGVCAGKRDKTFLGDVIVADRVFRYDAGKTTAFIKGEIIEKDFLSDIKTYNLNPKWKYRADDFPVDSWVEAIKNKRPVSIQYQEGWLLNTLSACKQEDMQALIESPQAMEHCPNWKETLDSLEKKDLIKIAETADDLLFLTDKGRSIANRARIKYRGNIQDPSEPKIHVAPIGTGSSVIEDPDIFKEVMSSVRKVLAIEMEAAAVGAIAEIEDVKHCIIAKAVSDYGDSDKNDHFREYAIETSYRFLIAFLREALVDEEKQYPQHESSLAKNDVSEVVPMALPNLENRDLVLENRENELQSYNSYIDKHNMTIITGLAGIGKTTIARALVEKRPGNVPTPFWYEFAEASSDQLGDILENLAGYFCNREFLAFKQERRAINRNDIDMLVRALNDEGEYWLIFDNLEKVLDEERRLPQTTIGKVGLSDLFKALESREHRAKIILASRYTPRLYDGQYLVPVSYTHLTLPTN